MKLSHPAKGSTLLSCRSWRTFRYPPVDQVVVIVDIVASFLGRGDWISLMCRLPTMGRCAFAVGGLEATSVVVVVEAL